MSQRYLATDRAVEACKEMKAIVEGGLAESIQKLNDKGTLLSNRDEWDGPSAIQFRNNWQEMYQALQKAREAVEQLRAQADQITKEIKLAAGGSGA